MGGILALAVAQGSGADKIATFLRSAVQDVFPTKRRWRLFAPKYDPAPLMDAASQFFGGNTTLGSIGRTGECLTKPGILVVCQHAHERRTRLLKGAYSKHLAKYANSIKVVDVVRSQCLMVRHLKCCKYCRNYLLKCWLRCMTRQSWWSGLTLLH